jgi:osmoprotectant transport system permease protein
MSYLLEHPDRVLALTIQHVQIVGIAVLVAIVLGVPLGLLITRLRWLEAPLINTVGVLYTVPSLALVAALIPFTGLGLVPAVVALILYSLLAIVRNTVAALDSIDPAMRDAARGVGMTNLQRLLLVARGRCANYSLVWPVVGRAESAAV